MTQRRALPAAVYEIEDPRASSAARVVPPDAGIVKVGTAVVGYAKSHRQSPEFDRQRYSRLEMQGRHLRKVLRALARLRASRGQPVGDRAAWTAVAADVAAAVIGPMIDYRKVGNLCVWVGFDADPSVLSRVTEKAARERCDDGFRIMPAAVIGKLVDLTTEEKATVAKALGLKRVNILAVDHQAARRAWKRQNEADRRRAGGARPRGASKAAQAKALGVHRSTLYRSPNATDSWTLPMEAPKTVK